MKARIKPESSKKMKINERRKRKKAAKIERRLKENIEMKQWR